MKQRYKQYFYENMKVNTILNLIEADDEDLESKVSKQAYSDTSEGKKQAKADKELLKKRQDAIIKLDSIKDELQKRIDTIYDKYTKEGKKKDLRVVKSENEADAEQIQKMKDGIDLANEKIEKLRSAAGIEDEEEPKEDSDTEETKDKKVPDDKKKEVEDKMEEIAGEGDIERLKSNLKMIDLAIVKLQVKLEASSTKSERDTITQDMFKLADRKEMFEKRIEQLESSKS